MRSRPSVRWLKSPIITHFYWCFCNDIITYLFQSWIFYYKIRLPFKFYTENIKIYLLFAKISLKETSINSLKALILLTKGWYMVTFASLPLQKCVKQFKYHRFDVRKQAVAQTTHTKSSSARKTTLSTIFDLPNDLHTTV